MQKIAIGAEYRKKDYNGQSFDVNVYFIPHYGQKRSGGGTRYFFKFFLYHTIHGRGVI